MAISRRSLLGSLVGILGLGCTKALAKPSEVWGKPPVDVILDENYKWVPAPRWRVGDYLTDGKHIYKLTNIEKPPFHAGNDKAIYWLHIDPFHRLGSVCPSHIFLTEEQMRDGYLGIRPYPFKVGDRVSSATQWDKNSDRFVLRGFIDRIDDQHGSISMKFDESFYENGCSFVGVIMPMEEALREFSPINHGKYNKYLNLRDEVRANFTLTLEKV